MTGRATPLGPDAGTRRVLVLAACALAAVVRLVPWDASAVDMDLDSSWKWIFHLVWARPFACGREVVFTWGPYAFLLTGSYHPATFALRIAFSVAIALPLTFALWRIVQAHTTSLWRSLAWMLGLIELIALSNPGESLFYVVDFVLLWLHWTVERGGGVERSRRDGWLLHGLCVAAALGGLVKFTYFLGAAVAIGAITAHETLVRRRLPRVAATFLASVIGWWLIARQPVTAFGAYVATSFEIAAGYTEGMGLPAPLHLVGLYLAAAAIVFGLLACSLRAARPGGALLHGVGLAALAFLMFKAAFVRFDTWHALPSSAALLLWLAAAFVSRGRGAHARIEAGAAACALVLILVLIDGVLRLIPPELPAQRLPGLFAGELRAWPAQIAAAGRVLSGRTGFAARHDETTAAIRNVVPLPPIAGAVDIYPALASVVLAHGLDYRPRPVIQSYCAFTPRLLALNADHLAGSRSPDRILWTISPLDSRLPSMDDSLSWPVLLARYEIVGPAVAPLTLRRRLAPRDVCKRPLESRRANFGEVVPVRSGEGRALWVEFELDRTILGRLASALYRAPGLLIGVRTGDGKDRTYRFVPGIAEAGFLLSPRVDSDEQFRRLAADVRSTESAEEVRDFIVSSLEVDDVSWAYGREYEVRLSVLELGP